MYQTHLEGAFQDCWGPLLSFLIQEVSVRAQDFAFLTSPQGLLLLHRTWRTSAITTIHLLGEATNLLAKAWVLESVSGKRDGRMKVSLDFRGHPYCWGQDQLPLTYTGYKGRMSGTRRSRMGGFWMGNPQPNNPFNVTGLGNMHSIHQFFVSSEEFSWPRFNYQRSVDFFSF